MGIRIDVTHTSWVSGQIVRDLEIEVEELKKVNSLLAGLDEYMEERGFYGEIGYDFNNQKAKLKQLEEDLKTMDKAASYEATMVNGMDRGTDLSITNIVNLCMDYPFFKTLEDTIEKISVLEIHNYTTKNENGIQVQTEGWRQKGDSINSGSEPYVMYEQPERLSMNDLLKSPFSRAMRKQTYETFRKSLFPNLDEETVASFEYDYLYEQYLRQNVDLANFNYTKEIEATFEAIAKVGFLLGIAAMPIFLSSTIAGALGMGGVWIVNSSLVINGLLTGVDVLSLLTGKHITGRDLTPREKEELMKDLAIDGIMFGMSLYAHVRLKQARQVSGTNSTLEGASGAGGSTGFDYLDDQLGNLKNKVKINKYASSEEINSFWKQQGYSQPPYNSKTVVQQVELLEDTKFVRVYDKVHTQLSGGWLMKAEDIKGLTPAQIKAKYALDFDPIYIGEATIPAGSKINIGEASGVFGQPGGGIQIDLNNSRIGKFEELGKITDWSFKK